jgi:heme-degrading monooxygenase HmoA
MYLTIRHYRGAGDPDVLMTRVAAEIVPLLQKQAGFGRYWAARGEDGDVFSITVFADRDAAQRANEAVRQQVVASLAELLPQPPTTYAGEVQVEALGATPDAAGFAIMSLRPGLPPPATMTPKVVEVLVPVFKAQPGFVAYFTARLEGEPDTGIVVSVWDRRESAEAGTARTGEAIRARMQGLVPEPSFRIRGELGVSA